ncbi:hypothetical protein ABFS83_01G109700 [Erythranthe nasuta]
MVIAVHPKTLRCCIFYIDASHFRRNLSLWSMKKKKFKTLDLKGKAFNWIKKYPCCFEVYRKQDELFCQLSKRMQCLVEEEEAVKDSQELVFVERLAKLLMMSKNQRLNFLKINELKRNFGFPDDYLLRIIELISRNPDFEVPSIEKLAKKEGRGPRFSCSLPPTWIKSWERFREFDSSPYISPYKETKGLIEGSVEMDKRTIGLVHELLSLTLWNKASILKLAHFRREVCLLDKLNVLLLKNPGIFYVSNMYQIYTVLLREGYNGSQLIEKDPLDVVKEKFGELMQEGLHEYNRRKKGDLTVRTERRKRYSNDEIREQDDDQEGGDLCGIFDAEERKRFYKVLFDDDSK